MTIQISAVPAWRAAIVSLDTTLNVNEIICEAPGSPPTKQVVFANYQTTYQITGYNDFSGMHSACLGTGAETFTIDDNPLSNFAWISGTTGSSPMVSITKTSPTDYSGSYQIKHIHGQVMESHELVICGVVLPDPSTMYVKGGPQNSIVKQLGVFTFDLEWMPYSYSS